MIRVVNIDTNEMFMTRVTSQVHLRRPNKVENIHFILYNFILLALLKFSSLQSFVTHHTLTNWVENQGCT